MKGEIISKCEPYMVRMIHYIYFFTLLLGTARKGLDLKWQVKPDHLYRKKWYGDQTKRKTLHRHGKNSNSTNTYPDIHELLSDLLFCQNSQ